MPERYSLLLKPAVASDLEAVPVRLRRRLVASIRKLAKAPFPEGAEKLAEGGKYRLREGNCRLVYSVDEGAATVWVVKVGQRRAPVEAAVRVRSAQ